MSVCFCVLCLTVLVDCLLDAFAICVGEVNVFYLSYCIVLGCVPSICQICVFV